MKTMAYAAAILLAGTALAPAHANLLVNGSFETGDFTGWTQVNDTSFTFVTGELAGGGPTDGAFHAAFGPTDPAGGGIVQTIATTAGSNYTITFDLANLDEPPNAFGLFWDGGFIDLTFDADPFDYQSFTYTVTASTASTDVGFIFSHTPSFWLLDNTSVAAAIPEPASWALMIAGFGLAGAAARRRVAKLTYA